MDSAAEAAAAVGAAALPAVGKGKTLSTPALLKEMTGWASLEGQWLRRKHFTPEVLALIAERIRECERDHAGELVVAIEAVSPVHERDSRMRALEVFGRLGVWDTPQNTGVLLYLALDRHRIEIIADRGVPAAPQEWEAICIQLQSRLAAREYAEGIFSAIDDIEAVMRRHIAPVDDSDAAEDGKAVYRTPRITLSFSAKGLASRGPALLPAL